MYSDIIVIPIQGHAKPVNAVGLIMDTVLVDGTKIAMSWYDSGMPKSYATFDSNDTERGIAVEWYESGKIREYYFHANGKKFGELQGWSEDGIMTERKIYFNDECIHDSIKLSKEDRSFLIMQYGKLHFIEKNKLISFKNNIKNR
jgi:antitoxin component YwqK of YwqJK toxin-antitoxin module